MTASECGVYYTQMLGILKSFARRLTEQPAGTPVPADEPIVPLVVPRAEHILSRSNISDYALKVLYRLHQAGYQAYLVGGGVRDLLLGREPKDFDIVTNARPEEIRSLFRNCRLIGRRFRLAHIHFGREIIETATFRRLNDASEEQDAAHRQVEDGRIVRDNLYGDSLEEDALRRDFTINALYYNISDFTIVDFAGGMADLKAGWLRLMGDPEQRYREDPVRMLRAIRFAVKLGFRIHPDTESPIRELAPLLEGIPPARLFEEVLKLFHSGQAVECFERLRHYGLFAQLLPMVESILASEEGNFPHTFIVRALANTDQRIVEGHPVAPYFLFAALYWEPVRRMTAERIARGESEHDALHLAASDVLNRSSGMVAIPKRIKLQVVEVWEMQSKLRICNGGRPFKLVEHPRFRAAYDFLVLRGESGEAVETLSEWWTRFQQADATTRREMTGAGRKPGRRRRRGGRRGSEPAGAGGDGGGEQGAG
jgi:poly(A) polymerase